MKLKLFAQSGYAYCREDDACVANKICPLEFYQHKRRKQPPGKVIGIKSARSDLLVKKQKAGKHSVTEDESQETGKTVNPVILVVRRRIHIDLLVFCFHGERKVCKTILAQRM
jgi:hypothetical protein